MTVDERVIAYASPGHWPLLAVLALVRWLHPSGASSSAADLILRVDASTVRRSIWDGQGVYCGRSGGGRVLAGKLNGRYSKVLEIFAF